MPMFGDLNKLNIQQEKQKHEVKQSARAVSRVPITNTLGQTSAEPPSPSTTIDNTMRRPSRHPNAIGSREHGALQPAVKSVLSPSPQHTNQSTDRLTNQSTSQLTSQSTYLPSNRIVGRPKAFYITERLDARLDDAVKYLQEMHGIRKVDRSTIVNALLDNEANWTEENLELLVSRVLSLLTSRLTS